MDYNSGPAEFTYLAKSLAAARGSPSEAFAMIADRKAAPDRVKRVLKSAVDAGTLADPTWGGSLADYRAISDNFLAALRTRSVFDRALADNAFMRVPLRTRFFVSTAAVTGAALGEMQMKPVSRLTLSGPTLEARKMAAQVAITDELARASGGAADGIVARELMNGVAAATDSAFFDHILAVDGLQILEATGTTAGNFLFDLNEALDAMTVGATSRIYVAVHPSQMKTLALDVATLAGSADLTLQGGTIGGVTVLPSDQQVDGTATVFDASRIAAGSDVIVVRVSSQADLQLSDDPSDVEHQLVSLWQTNSIGIIAERYCGFEVTSASAVCLISDTVSA